MGVVVAPPDAGGGAMKWREKVGRVSAFGVSGRRVDGQRADLSPRTIRGIFAGMGSQRCREAGHKVVHGRLAGLFGGGPGARGELIPPAGRAERAPMSPAKRAATPGGVRGPFTRPGAGRMRAVGRCGPPGASLRRGGTLESARTGRPTPAPAAGPSDFGRPCGGRAVGRVWCFGRGLDCFWSVVVFWVVGLLGGVLWAEEPEVEPLAAAEGRPEFAEPATDFSRIFRVVPKAKITPRVLQRATPEETNLYISLTQQKAYLFVRNEVAIETPISSGRRAAMTPMGSFSVVEKVERMPSAVYGDFVDKQGNVVRRGISAKLDSAPGGTTFRPQPLRYFLRLNWTGLGLHAGHLPGYPAAQTHVRFPEEIARLIFEHTREGTPVVIGH